MNLNIYRNAGFDRGASRFVEALWILVSVLFSSFLPGSYWRVLLLRLFGADIGRGVVCKPHVRVKFPWRLSLGDNCWIGESVWIDNLATVRVGANSCISQGVYICTGNHDWKSKSFALRTGSVDIGENVWLGAMSRIGPGVTVDQGVVLSFGSTLTKRAEPWTVYATSGADPKCPRRVERP